MSLFFLVKKSTGRMMIFWPRWIAHRHATEPLLKFISFNRPVDPVVVGPQSVSVVVILFMSRMNLTICVGNDGQIYLYSDNM